MPIGLHNPLPSNLASECSKAAKILRSFVDPAQSFGPDKVIPPSILAQAKGLVILTVVKGGFLASVRFGSGLVIARLSDGTWSAPSAITTAGAGFGGQIGAELTDFVMVLNDSAAIRTFSQAGSVTLGGNVSIAAGPVGRNAEASGAASLRSVAGVFSYSKTKGLFLGVSLEGSVLLERKDANKKFYNYEVTARQLLGGNIPSPPAADALIRVLNSRVFRGNVGDNSDMYNSSPVYEGDEFDGHRGGGGRKGSFDAAPRRTATWHDDVYDRGGSASSPQRSMSTRRDPNTLFGRHDTELDSRQLQRTHLQSTYSDKGQAPGKPAAPKPNFKAPPRAATMGANQAVALYSFEGDQEGDLSFKKGDIITITKKTDSKNDWWTGQLGGKTGIFPSNYVDTV